MDAPEFDARIAGFTSEWMCEWPGDFLSFYKHCNGVSLFGNALRFRPLEAVEQAEDMTGQTSTDFQDEITILDAGPWVRFCDLADGSSIAIELRETYKKGWKVVRVDPACNKFNAIVAWSFQDFLERALSSGGRLDMLKELS